VGTENLVVRRPRFWYKVGIDPLGEPAAQVGPGDGEEVTQDFSPGKLQEEKKANRKERSMSSSETPQSSPTPQDLKAAMKAFRKRLKLTRLDDQSRIGVGPFSSGRESGIVAISPPEQFPQAVWDELVRQGKLRRAGQGQYELGQP